MDRKIDRLRRTARAYLRRRVDVEICNDGDIEGTLVLVRRNFIIVRIRKRGITARVRIPFTRIEEINLD